MASLESVLVFAFASVLGNIDLSRKRSYVEFWGGGKKLHALFSRYGVPHEFKVYTTTVKGRKYTRYKIIVRDHELIKHAKRITETDTRIKWYMLRYRRIARRVMRAMMRCRGWKKLEEMGESFLKRLLGIKPYVSHVYEWFRNKKIVRVLKPNWRFYLYLRRLYAESPLLADKIKERYLYRRTWW